MLEGFWSYLASGAGCVRVLVEPGGVGGQVAFRRSPLVDPSCHKVPQAHEGMRREGGGIVVVWGSGYVGGPILEKHVPNAVSKGTVGFPHEFGGRDFCSRRCGGVKDQVEARKAFLQWEGEVS